MKNIFCIMFAFVCTCKLSLLHLQENRVCIFFAFVFKGLRPDLGPWTQALGARASGLRPWAGGLGPHGRPSPCAQALGSGFSASRLRRGKEDERKARREGGGWEKRKDRTEEWEIGMAEGWGSGRSGGRVGVGK